jgi:hypothetical protein
MPLLPHATGLRRHRKSSQPILTPGKNGVLCPLCTTALGLPAREWTRSPVVVAAGTNRLESGVWGTKRPEGVWEVDTRGTKRLEGSGAVRWGVFDTKLTPWGDGRGAWVMSPGSR